MQMSEQISELTKALAQAQGEFHAAPKTGENPHLQNHYATLDDVIGAIREPLSKHGLSFVQPIKNTDNGLVMETILLHESGQWLGCEAVVPDNPGNRGVSGLQALGGALTYMRRYMLTAMLGINAEEDNDGNGGQSGGSGAKSTKQEPKRPRKRAAKKPAKQATTKRKPISLDDAAMKAILDAGHAENPANAARMVNLSTVLTKDDAPEVFVAWAAVYRAARDGGKEPAEAAKVADAAQVKGAGDAG